MYYNLNWPYSLHTAASVLFVSRVSLISHKNSKFELAYLILIKIKIIYYFCNDNYEVLSNNLIRVIFFSITYSRYKNNWSCSSVKLYSTLVSTCKIYRSSWSRVTSVFGLRLSNSLLFQKASWKPPPPLDPSVSASSS